MASANSNFSIKSTTRRSTSLVFQDEVKRGSVHPETKAPPNGGREASTARSGFFSFQGFCIKLMLFNIPLLAFLIYDLQLLEENLYTGIGAIEVDFWFCANYVFWLIILTILYPSRINRPTDVFPVLYLPTSCLCSVIYWKTTGLLNTSDATLLLLLLTSPVFALKFARHIPSFRLRPSISIPKPFLEKNLPRTLLLILAVATLYGYILNGSVGGFDLATSYDRRLHARDAFSDNMFARYLFDNAMNGALPFLAFIAGRNRSIKHFVLAIAFALFNFWLMGAKATFLYIAFMFFLGRICLNGKQDKLPSYFLMAVFFIFVGALAEHFIAGKSLIADYIIRRAFMLGAQIQTYYFDAIFNDQNFPNTLLTGLPGNSPPSFLIGEAYFANPATNANTNAFVYALALSGLLGLLLCVMFVCVFFRMLDQSYAKTGSSNALAIISLYALFLLEQAFTIAFISSGIFLCFLLISSARIQKNLPSRYA